MAVNTCYFLFVLFTAVLFYRFGDANPNTQSAYCDGDSLGLLQQPFFVDLSRVVIVQWNRKSFCSCLLLLCGDVHLNPGPAVDFPRSICERNVLDGDKAVCCDSCDMWVHVSYDSSFSDSVYDAMVED